MNVQDFEGKMDPNEFLDWLYKIKLVFEYEDHSEEKKVKMVALKLRKYASLWWRI